MDRERVIGKLSALEFDGASYKVVRELGRGGNGVALLCRKPNGDQLVAKVYIPPDSRDLDDKALERFENEIALTGKLRHPNIVPSLGSGTAMVGTYRLPFYLMPQAVGTLRNEIRNDTDPDQIEKKLRLFLRAAYGVACLHSHGIVHRDLKPENILLGKAGIPWVADLGIAHVNPDFVSVGLKTIESERLLNRDYYAPEQRFGKATAVDHRADVYAMGCIFYEMLTSIPPVRANAPKLSLISSAFKPFEPIWERMIAWEAAQRFPTLEDALEELSVTIGWVLASLRGAAGLQHPDTATMLKLLKTSNENQRQQGIEIAIRLGRSALPELHNLLGHTRRDIRNSAAIALGKIADTQSLPYLVGGLYGTAARASQFRPSVDTAAHAISEFAPEDRMAALRLIKYPIRPAQIQTTLNGLGGDEVYNLVEDLHKAGLIFIDWSESHFELLAEVDENRAWPEIIAMVGRREDSKLQNVYRRLSPSKKCELLEEWVERGVSWSWYYTWLLDAVLMIECDPLKRRGLLGNLEIRVREYSGKFDERPQLLKRIQDQLKNL